MARHSSIGSSSSSSVDVVETSSATAMAATNLSDDMLAEIILRLPIDSVARSKCVSKSWRATISDDFLRRRLPLHLSVLYFPSSSGKASARPRFASADDDAGTLQDRDLGSFFPFLDAGSVVVDASNGLLLLLRSTTSTTTTRRRSQFYVVDPVTRRWATLPPPSKDPRLSILAFDPSSSSSSSSSSSGNYYVVNFTGRWRDRGGEVEVYSSETRAWAVRDADFGVPASSLSGSVHFHAGALYVLASDPDCVVRMDLAASAAAGAGGGIPCAVAELPEPADGGGEGRLAHSAGRLHYVTTSDGGAAMLRIKVWVLDGEAPALRWRLKHAVKLGDDVVEEGSEAARFMALHPEKDAVYVWSAAAVGVGKKKKQQQQEKLVEYDLKRKEVTGAWAFGDGGEGEKNRVVKTWLVPSAMYLSDCLPLPDAHVQEQC